MLDVLDTESYRTDVKPPMPGGKIYQLAFVTPGILPASAIFVSLKRTYGRAATPSTQFSTTNPATSAKCRTLRVTSIRP